MVFEDTKTVEAMNEKMEEIAGEKGLVLKVLTDMNNFQDNVATLDSLVDEDFLLLTTREGSRGVDYRGKDIAYVIMVLNELTLSEFQ